MRFTIQSFRLSAFVFLTAIAVTGCGKTTESSGTGGESPKKVDDTPKTTSESPGKKVEIPTPAAATDDGRKNLLWIGLACQNFNDFEGQMPFPGIVQKEGNKFKTSATPNLSWRVAILPMLEQGELFKLFHLNEPWDSEHNKKLIAKMPKIYAPPSDVEAKEGYTFLRCFVGPEAMRQGLTFINVVTGDGSSNTFMVVESGEAVPWTKPDEMVYDPKKPLPKLGGYAGGKKMRAVFVDGSVHTFDLTKVSEKVLRAMITTNGGEEIDWNALKPK